MLSLTGQPLDEPESVRLMTARLIHRGPDEEGYYVNSRRTVSLGHRRLRIIDLQTGRQPLGNEDGSVMVVFNGEIYGYRALREALRERGHQFRTMTDTEVIVHLYEDEGVDCLHRLRGMFAMAIWDERAETLLLARDRLGKKPLYYAFRPDRLLFASELPALTAMQDLSGELDVVGLDQYLTLGYIPAPRTVYHHVCKLEAGHALVVKAQKASSPHKIRYWAPPASASSNGHSVPDWVEAKQELVHRLRTATELRMVSDVPIGCFLSGGVDSSTVLSFMAELSSYPVKTFSIGFPESEYSELVHARTVARHFGTDHHEYVLEPGGIDVLDQIVGHFGEPFADSSALPTWYLSKLTRKSVTVALTGDGGDELFAGYPWYVTGRLLEWASQFPSWVVQAGCGLAKLGGLRLASRARRVASLVALSSGQRFAALRAVVKPELKQILYTPEFAKQVGEHALSWLAARYEESPGDTPLNRMMATDLITYLAEDLLVKVDRMSMAHALECRSPFLDADLVEWALALPAVYKLPPTPAGFSGHTVGKRLLKEAVRDRFPDGFLDRPKQGFTVPLERWFRNSLQGIVRERVLHGGLNSLGYFDPTGIRRVVEEHFTGRANHAAAVWALLVLASWKERYAI